MAKRAEKYAYITGLKNMLRQNHIAYYDFTDATALSADDCEFVDGFHGGEVLYARILNAMADADDTLKRYVDTAYLQTVISQYKGKAFIPDSAITGVAEIDFLKLGCKKTLNAKTNKKKS